MIRMQAIRARNQMERGWSLIEVLIAMVIIAVGVVVFVKMQHMSILQNSGNTKMLEAGHLIEKQMEDMRINIAQDTTNNWPPGNLTISPTAPDYITLIRQVYTAHSPKDGAVVNNVDSVSITTYWGNGPLDTLKVNTYVSKRF